MALFDGEDATDSLRHPQDYLLGVHQGLIPRIAVAVPPIMDKTGIRPSPGRQMLQWSK